MQPFALSVIAFLFVWPTSIELVPGTATDIVASDLLLTLPFLSTTKQHTAHVNQTIPRNSSVQYDYLFITYVFILGLIGVWISSDVTRLLSAVKFVKPYLFLIVGAMLVPRIDPDGISKQIAIMASIVAMTLLFSTAISPGFPRIRWGASFFGLPVYGFPNSPAVYWALFVPLQLATSRTTKDSKLKVFLLMSALGTGMLAIFSLSRSAMIATVLGATLFFMLARQIKILIYLCVVSIASIFGYMLITGERIADFANILYEMLMKRSDRTFVGDDPSSGRFDIWMEVYDLWQERPLCGYLFESFVNYSSHGNSTPHNQYLEVIFKTGLIGFTLFFAVCVTSTWSTITNWYNSPDDSSRRMYLSAILSSQAALYVTNMTQPNITYSMTGNLWMFIIGLYAFRKKTTARRDKHIVFSPTP